MAVFWVVTPCSPCSSDDGGGKYLWNVGKFLPDYIAQQPRRQPSSYSSHENLNLASLFMFVYLLYDKPVGAISVLFFLSRLFDIVRTVGLWHLTGECGTEPDRRHSGDNTYLCLGLHISWPPGHHGADVFMIAPGIFCMLFWCFCIFAFYYITSNSRHVVQIPSCRWQLQYWRIYLRECYFHLWCIYILFSWLLVFGWDSYIKRKYVQIFLCYTCFHNEWYLERLYRLAEGLGLPPYSSFWLSSYFVSYETISFVLLRVISVHVKAWKDFTK
jgi:hypothetical protein